MDHVGVLSAELGRILGLLPETSRARAPFPCECLGHRYELVIAPAPATPVCRPHAAHLPSHCCYCAAHVPLGRRLRMGIAPTQPHAKFARTGRTRRPRADRPAGRGCRAVAEAGGVQAARTGIHPEQSRSEGQVIQASPRSGTHNVNIESAAATLPGGEAARARSGAARAWPASGA